MKDHGLLFTPDLAQAIFEGTKTQTRRPVKNKTGTIMLDDGSGLWPCSPSEAGWLPVMSPHGMPGDRIWVRETWQAIGPVTVRTADNQEMVAGIRIIPHPTEENDVVHRSDERYQALHAFVEKWRPSLHMPRCAARSVCEITDIRVERPEDISLADAIAEGFESQAAFIASYRARYTQPYCWAITFRRLP